MRVCVRADLRECADYHAQPPNLRHRPRGLLVHEALKRVLAVYREGIGGVNSVGVTALGCDLRFIYAPPKMLLAMGGACRGSCFIVVVSDDK